MPVRNVTLPGDDPGGDAGFWVSRRHGRRERAVLAAGAYDGEVLAVLANAFRTFDRGNDERAPDGGARSTLRVYRVGVKRWVAFAEAEGVDLLSAEPDDVVAWVRELERGEDGEGGFVPATVASYLAGVRWLYVGFRRLGACTVDPVRDVRVRPDRRAVWDRREVYLPQEAGRLIDVAVAGGELSLALAVSLGMDAGLRASEIVSVTFGDFNLDSRMLRVSQAKGGRPRESALLSRAVERYSALLPVPDRTQRVYPYSTAWLRLEVARLCGAANVPYRGVHGLRHAHAMDLAQRGIPLQTLASQLGHSTVRSTQVYVKLNDAAQVHRLLDAESDRDDGH